MAKKKVSDTIKQQRKAQKEFLELKKMQSGEIEPAPKPSEIEIKPKTFWEKVKNIWFHDKTAILITTAIVAIFTFFTVECAMKTKPDLQVVVFTYNTILDESCEKMQEYFKPYCPDINGDGEVYVKVLNCSFNKENSDFSFKNNRISRLQATIAAEANALLFITDDESYQYFQSIDNGNFFVGEKVFLDKDFHEACRVDEKLNLPIDLSISCRDIKDKMIEVDEDAPEYFKISQQILNELNSKNENK